MVEKLVTVSDVREVIREVEVKVPFIVTKTDLIQIEKKIPYIIEQEKEVELRVEVPIEIKCRSCSTSRSANTGTSPL